MKRDLEKLGYKNYDILVVGAGIQGASIARDAALRGLKVALIDKGDFGGETSHNSLKIIHGGLRYLQHADFRRLRQSVRERRFWLKNAPHLVKPLPFVIPTYGHFMKGPEALYLALKVYNFLSSDRNFGLSKEQRIPKGRILSKAKCQKMIPGIKDEGLTGGALWYDGHVMDADRLVMETIISAERAGADVFNYVELKRFLGSQKNVIGAELVDRVTKRRTDVFAEVTINAAGPWVQSLLGSMATDKQGLSKGMNLVVRRKISDYAFGIVSRRKSDALISRGGRMFFVTPWGEYSIIGTSHVPYDRQPGVKKFKEEEVQEFIREINMAYPPLGLKRSDVAYVYSGFTPAGIDNTESDVKRSRQSQIWDHQKKQGIQGLISVLSVKFTTARLVAEKSVDMALKKMGRRHEKSTTESLPFPGSGGSREFQRLKSDALRNWGKIFPEKDLVNLVKIYGTDYHRVLALGASHNVNGQDTLFRRQCRYVVREEMAITLDDVVFHRLHQRAFNAWSVDQLEWCASMMASELKWSKSRQENELQYIKKKFQSHTRQVKEKKKLEVYR